MKLRIGILGTRGIPNRYGGFEQFASYLSKGLSEKGHEVSVYNAHDHLYQEKNWNGVNIIHCYDPSSRVGTAGQFIYDLNCLIDARKRQYDILLVLGYTSSSVWGRLYPAKCIVVTNMDGLEWKRSKYSAPVQRFLRYAEKLAVTFSNIHVADSLPVQEYLYDKYAIQAHYISYGATEPEETRQEILATFGVRKDEYCLLIARMEPENHIETILAGFCKIDRQLKIIVVGGTGNAYGKRMLKKFGKHANVIFTGTIYDTLTLNTMRKYCLLYFHGHSVGGTNPSLLEAMACGALICAHDNVFNRAVTGNDAFYFNSENDIMDLPLNIIQNNVQMKANNHAKIAKDHAWSKIINEYETLFINAYRDNV